MRLFDKNDEVIYNFEGRRLVKCLLCGKIDYADNFSTYGGLGQVNKGKCRECVSKLDGYRKLHGYRKLTRTTRPLTDSMEDLEILAQTYRQQEEN